MTDEGSGQEPEQPPADQPPQDQPPNEPESLADTDADVKEVYGSEDYPRRPRRGPAPRKRL